MIISDCRPDIHKTMVQDRVRTGAYDRFIRENSHLFQGKRVLDVGCGTGILSLMCARAGAKQVVSVDNAKIIDKAKRIARDNGFGEVITLVKLSIIYIVTVLIQAQVRQRQPR